MKHYLTRLCFLLLLWSTDATRPSRREHHEVTETDLSGTVRYLKKYGYMNTGENSGRPISSTDDPRLSASIRRMQHFFHLPVTGRPDRQTVEMMRQPRCGCPDVVAGGEGAGEVMMNIELPLQYSITGRSFRWTKTDISYKHLNYPSGQNALQPQEVRRIIKKAFKVWSDVTPLTFREVQDPSQGADIKIKFGSRMHHAEEPQWFSFDGKDGELAHAFSPNSFWGDLEGDIHFDDDEMFTANGRVGYALFLVAAHEIGHSLGLAHSDDPDSLMWPNYMQVPVNGYQLPQDDTQGIQHIYGVRLGDRPEPDRAVAVPTRRTKRPPDAVYTMCHEPFTALLKMDNTLFAFRDNLVWLIRISDRQLLSPPGGERAQRYWKGLPKRITAVYQRGDGNVVFFKGSKYYVYNGKRRVGQPKRLSAMRIRRPPMAALQASQMAPNKTYLIRGDQVWLYDEVTEFVEAGYPRRVSEVWVNLPTGVTGGEMLNDGSFLFLKGSRYFEVNVNNQITSQRGSRAHLFSVDFLGCSP
ncbi:matrilysin-like [Acanthaster planci]|uniref:Matrilysin-like n=1 Tax=Acanthaster planci TaxID=133434 RepID=A0A8B7XJP0_ACAPL|nr:matrilysin-like [Acanthaster planci]